MPNKLPISVFIITKNEADRISYAIESVRNIASEVIVIDSGSEDNTVEISESLGAKVFFNEWDGYVKQKIFGEAQCKYDWILNIDADEALSKELAEEIVQIFEGSPKENFYRLKILMQMPFEDKPKNFAPSNTPIRLYNRKYASFKKDDVDFSHDSVIPFASVNIDNITVLNNIVHHKSIRSIAHLLEKSNFYTSIQAEEMYLKGRKPNPIRIILEPIIFFIKVYLLRRYFLHGFDGFIYSVIFSYIKFIRLAKARECWHIKDL